MKVRWVKVKGQEHWEMERFLADDGQVFDVDNNGLGYRATNRVGVPFVNAGHKTAKSAKLAIYRHLGLQES